MPAIKPRQNAPRTSSNIPFRRPRPLASATGASPAKRLKRDEKLEHDQKVRNRSEEIEAEFATDSDPIVESDTASHSGADDGVSWPSEGEQEEAGDMRTYGEEENDEEGNEANGETEDSIPTDQAAHSKSTSSREAHAKQKTVAQERKAAKPNADSIARTKKLWERLRRKSHIKLEERTTLIRELFDIITGRVHDFVMKHDATRVIQTALKYGNLEQRKMIAKELKGEYKELAKGRYSKFLIGKILVHGDDEIRDMVVPEFYGSVRSMIKHPEASWILDDVYRGVASPEQQAILLREWYGAEFALFRQQKGEGVVSSDLGALLKEKPEKRTPVMRSLHDLINHLVQKKTTGFTMLHDAMLQYYINTTSGSEEASEFIELLKGDEEGDLLKNLAFTKSGARLVCLALAYGTAKDRKHILRVYKGLFQTLAYDVHGHQIILTAYDVIDDTVMVSKLIFPELVGKDSATMTETQRHQQEQEVFFAAIHLSARVALLYLFADKSKAILTSQDHKLLSEVHAIRTISSKKDPDIRRNELRTALTPPLLDFIAHRALDLASTSFGCQFMSEVILASVVTSSSARVPALEAIARLLESPTNSSAATIAPSPSNTTAIAKTIAGGDGEGGGDKVDDFRSSPHFGRLLKTLILGGRYDPKNQRICAIEPPLGFHELFYNIIANNNLLSSNDINQSDHEREEEQLSLMEWATGPNSFTIVGLLEADGFTRKEDVMRILRKNKSTLAASARGVGGGGGGTNVKEEIQSASKRKRNKNNTNNIPPMNGDEKSTTKKTPAPAGNAGARILLSKIDD